MSPERWQEISPYLDQALTLTEDERGDWLASIRQKNPEIGDLVQQLLRDHHLLVEEQFLEASHIPLPDLKSLAGQRIGAYTLISQIGEGGMRSVWLAERSDGRFERRSAIKFVHAVLAGSAGARRFGREGRILGALAHPHIAELIDAGVSPVGQPYLVLEYVEGDHIDLFCDRRGLDVAARIRLFLDVLTAVTHAHRSLIVHRDIKPSNVLVRNDGQVKLLDFGISKLLERANQEGDPGPLTAESGTAMTPEYAAPEQLLGGAITTGTDIYSLGVLLYVLLTGCHPAGDGPHSVASLVKAIVDKQPKRLSEAVAPPRAIDNAAIDTAVIRNAAIANAAKRSTTPEKLRRTLRGDLDTIVAKTLKKDPVERYASVSALSEDLERYLRSEPISARRDSAAYRATKFIRRNRLPVTLAGVALAAVIVSLIVAVIQLRVARTQRDIAFRKILRSEALKNFDAFLLSDAAALGKLSVSELLGRAERVVARQHEADNTGRVELMVSIGSQYSMQDDENNARRVLEEAYKLSRGLSDRSARAMASCALAGSLARNEELPRAEALFQAGLHELPEDPQFVFDRIDCLRSGSQVAEQRGDIEETVARAETAQRVLRKSPFDTDGTELTLWTDLGGAYSAAGRDAEAVTAFRNGARLLSSMGRDGTGTAETLFNNWALELDQIGQPLAAESTYRRAMDIRRDNHTEDSVSPMVLNNYAWTLSELDRLPEAAVYAERAYEKARLADFELAIDQSLLIRGRIYTLMHKLDRAAAVLAEVEPRLRKVLPPGHYAFASLAAQQALVSGANGHFPEATRLIDQALSIIEAAIKSGGEGVFLLPGVFMNRSTIALDAGRYDQAQADAERALRELRKTLPAGTPSFAEGRSYLLLSRALWAEGKYAEARAAAGSAVTRLEATVGPNHSDTQSARLLAAREIPQP
jgi:serine/threonine protein kinase